MQRLLDERAMSGRELSRLTGIQQKTLADKLAGRSAFGLNDLQKVCAVLEVDVDELIGWAQKH